MAAANEAVEMDTDEKTTKLNEYPDEKIVSFSQNNENISCGSDEKFVALPCSSFSKLLEGVEKAAHSTQIVVFQDQFDMPPHGALAPVTTEVAQVALSHTKTESQDDTSVISSIQQPAVAHSESSVSGLQSLPDIQHVKEEIDKNSLALPPGFNSSSHEIPGAQSSSVTIVSFAALPSPQEKVDKLHSDKVAHDVSKTPQPDGYSWRKYGQKQVKSSGSSRSYYRCTNLSCSAKKKVEHLDISGKIIEVVYKGDHNHDPPQNPNKSFGRKKSFNDSLVQKPEDLCSPKSGAEQMSLLTFECQEGNLNGVVGTSHRDNEEHYTKTPDTTLTTPRLESDAATPAEAMIGGSCHSDETVLTDTMKERDVPFKKRRIRENGKACSESVYRTFKEPEVVMHPPGDVGSSNDGYRWRKYGQKMVKGNSHPRSYYRCSSAGCPVRKHVERATDGSLAIVAMYEGKHNHDMPAPKKQHSSTKSPVVDASNGTASNSVCLSSKEMLLSPGHSLPSQQSRDLDSTTGDDKTGSEAGADKVIESTQTLLSASNSACLNSKEKMPSPGHGSPSQQSRDLDGNIGDNKTDSEAEADKVIESTQTLLNVGIELKSC